MSSNDKNTINMSGNTRTKGIVASTERTVTVVQPQPLTPDTMVYDMTSGLRMRYSEWLAGRNSER